MTFLMNNFSNPTDRLIHGDIVDLFAEALSIKPLLSQATKVVVPVTDVHNVQDDSDDDEPCGKHFDQRSNPTGCGICLYLFHAKCTVCLLVILVKNLY